MIDGAKSTKQITVQTGMEDSTMKQLIQNLLKYHRLQRAFTKYLQQADEIDQTPSTKFDRQIILLSVLAYIALC